MSGLTSLVKRCRKNAKSVDPGHAPTKWKNTRQREFSKPLSEK